MFRFAISLIGIFSSRDSKYHLVDIYLINGKFTKTLKLASFTLPPRFEPVTTQWRLGFPAMAVSTSSDMTRELPSPTSVPVDGSTTNEEVANQAKLFVTPVVL